MLEDVSAEAISGGAPDEEGGGLPSDGSVGDDGETILTVHDALNDLYNDRRAHDEYEQAYLVRLLDAIVAYWTAAPPRDGTSMEDFARSLLFVDDGSAGDNEADTAAGVMVRIDREARGACVRLYTLAQYIALSGLGGADCALAPHASRLIERCRLRVQKCREVLDAVLEFTYGGDDGSVAAAADMYATPDESPLLKEDFHKLVLFVLRQLMKRGYRRYKGRCYEQIVVEHDGVLWRTHAWRPVAAYDGNIKAFMYGTVTKEAYPEMWAIMVMGHTTKNVADYLSLGCDSEFPQIVPIRTNFSFTNGVYLARDNRFCEYGSGDFPTDVACCKYFPLPFDPTWVEPESDWRDIPTPRFDAILRYQDLDDDVIEWVFAFMGRCIYDLKTPGCDGWEMALFIIGLAGTGKSTILNIIKSWYNPDDVGVISSNMEKKFGLSALLDKYVVIWFEVRDGGGPEQTEIQSMISAEDMTIAIKNELAVSKQWRTPLIMAGNEHGFRKNNSGQMDRRLAVIQFVKKVKDMDPTLNAHFKSLNPAFIAKCNQAYTEFAIKYGSRDVWNCMPESFRRTREEVARELNPMAKFLHETDDLVWGGDDHYMEFKTLQQMFNDYCHNGNIPRTQMSTVDITHVLATKKAAIVHGKRTWEGEEVTATWVTGVTVQGREHVATY